MEVDRLAPTFSSHAVHVSLPRVVAPYSSISWSLFSAIWCSCAEVMPVRICAARLLWSAGLPARCRA